MRSGRPFRISNFAKALGGFTILQMIGFLAPFLALPVIARIAEPSEWVHLAVAQAVGSLTGIAILYGWWTAGPAAYHKLQHKDERIALYQQSVLERLLVACIALPTMIIVVHVISPADNIELYVMASVAMATYGLTPDWFFIAQNRPLKLAIYETLPRSVSTLASIPFILTTGAIIWYPIIQAGAVLLAYVLMLAIETPKSLGQKPSIKAAGANLQLQTPIALASVLGGAYNQFAIPLAALIVPTVVLAPYVSADKLYKASRFSIGALGNTLQSWVLTDPTYSRQMIAIRLHVIWGFVGAVLIFVLTPWATMFLFGGSLAAGPYTSAALAVAFLCTSVTTPLVRNVLIPAGQRRTPLFATFIATAAGLGGMWPLFQWLGLPGIGIAIALSETVSLGINGLGAARILRSTREN